MRRQRSSEEEICTGDAKLAAAHDKTSDTKTPLLRPRRHGGEGCIRNGERYEFDGLKPIS
jgi:hypothetical protein